MTETYENMELLLKHIQHTKYNRDICGDLKVVALLLKMQLGYTKYCCYLCEWDRHTREPHYIKKKWCLPKKLVPGHKKKKTHEPLIEPTDIFASASDKIWSGEKFHESIEQERLRFLLSETDSYVCMYFSYFLTDHVPQIFSKITDTKIKENIFVGPQISYIINDRRFEQLLMEPEKITRKATDVIKNFLGYYKAPNYIQLVDNHLIAYKTMK